MYKTRNIWELLYEGKSSNNVLNIGLFLTQNNHLISKDME